MLFEFATAARILFGEGTLRDVAPAARAMGRRALLVTGASADRAAGLISILEAAAVTCLPFAVKGEPTIQLIRQGTEYARREGCDLVIAMGGGSAIDAGKALAAMLTNPGDPLEYLEVIGGNPPLDHPSPAFIATPTTAAAGAAGTPHAQLGS